MKRISVSELRQLSIMNPIKSFENPQLLQKLHEKSPRFCYPKDFKTKIPIGRNKRARIHSPTNVTGLDNGECTKP